tara:strand:+ start:332 stop:943 length:612 start_codon:yes stop_codon:yes gene_type:complete
MPMKIGIENGLEKGFTKEEIQVTNGFPLAVLCMHTGTGRIGEGRYSASAEETYERFVLMMDALNWKPDEVSEFITLENVKRLEEAGWTANIGHRSKEEFMWHLKNMAFDKLFNKHKPSYINRTESYETWNDVCNRKDMIRTIVGDTICSDREGRDIFYIEEMCQAFKVWDEDLSEPFYNGKYLIWDEESETPRLVNNKPEVNA